MIRRALGIATCLAAVAVLPATASATQYLYCTYTIIDSGANCYASSDHYVVGLEGQSTGTAYAQVYTTFQDHSRSSAIATSPGPGQMAGIYWAYSNRPWGYPTLHNHSGFLSRFNGWYYL